MGLTPGSVWLNNCREGQTARLACVIADFVRSGRCCIMEVASLRGTCSKLPRYSSVVDEQGRTLNGYHKTGSLGVFRSTNPDWLTQAHHMVQIGKLVPARAQSPLQQSWFKAAWDEPCSSEVLASPLPLNFGARFRCFERFLNSADRSCTLWVAIREVPGSLPLPRSSPRSPGRSAWSTGC